jgi:hypothetical protein
LCSGQKIIAPAIVDAFTVQVWYRGPGDANRSRAGLRSESPGPSFPPSERRRANLKNEQVPSGLLIPRATAMRSHREIHPSPMAYILKGKVSSLRLMAIIWTASSDAAWQACGEAAARGGLGSAQAVTTIESQAPSRPGPGPGFLSPSISESDHSLATVGEHSENGPGVGPRIGQEANLKDSD